MDSSMMEIRYLQGSRLRNPSRKQFMLLGYTLCLNPDEIFELNLLKSAVV